MHRFATKRNPCFEQVFLEAHTPSRDGHSSQRVLSWEADIIYGRLPPPCHPGWHQDHQQPSASGIILAPASHLAGIKVSSRGASGILGIVCQWHKMPIDSRGRQKVWSLEKIEYFNSSSTCLSWWLCKICLESDRIKWSTSRNLFKDPNKVNAFMFKANLREGSTNFLDHAILCLDKRSLLLRRGTCLRGFTPLQNASQVKSC